MRKKRAIFYAGILSIVLFSACAKSETELSDQTTATNGTVSRESVMAVAGEAYQKTEESSEVPVEITAASEDQSPAPALEYKIIMVGDVLLHTPVEESCR